MFQSTGWLSKQGGVLLCHVITSLTGDYRLYGQIRGLERPQKLHTNVLYGFKRSFIQEKKRSLIQFLKVAHAPKEQSLTQTRQVGLLKEHSQEAP